MSVGHFNATSLNLNAAGISTLNFKRRRLQRLNISTPLSVYKL